MFDVTTTNSYVARANAHALAESAETTGLALASVFEELDRAGVEPTGIVLKPNFVTPGLDAPAVPAGDVAAATYEVLLDTVPAAVPGIAFLSGGHPTADVCAFLSDLNAIAERTWQVTFSFGRALVSDALRTWAGDAANVAAVQRRLLENGCGAAEATR